MFSRKTTGLLVAAALLAAGIFAAAAFNLFSVRGEVRAIPMTEALSRIKGGEKVVVLDVRTQDERDADGFIPGSVSLPLDVSGEFGSQVERLIPDKDATIFVYCRSGRRSQSACEIMAQAGYSNLYNIGGIIDVPEGAIG